MFVLLLGLTLAQPNPSEPPGGWRGGRPPSPPAESLMDVLDHRDELMALLEKHDPQQHMRMLRIEQRDPQAFALGLLRVAKQVERIQSDPVAAERFKQLQAESQRVKSLVDGYHDLPASDQKGRRGEIKAAAKRIMELKQAERRARVEELREKMAELESDIDGREKQANELVDAFVEQLLTEKVDL